VQGGYRGWYVTEQEKTLDEDALPDPAAGPAADPRERGR